MAAYMFPSHVIIAVLWVMRRKLVILVHGIEDIQHIRIIDRALLSKGQDRLSMPRKAHRQEQH